MSDKHIRSLSDFEKRWLKIFAAEVSKNDIEKYVLESGPFIWHVFSFGLIAKDTYLEKKSPHSRDFSYELGDKKS